MGNFTPVIYRKCSLHHRIRATHLRVWKMQPVDQVSWMMTARHAFVRQVLLERCVMKVKSAYWNISALWLYFSHWPMNLLQKGVWLPTIWPNSRFKQLHNKIQASFYRHHKVSHQPRSQSLLWGDERPWERAWLSYIVQLEHFSNDCPK